MFISQLALTGLEKLTNQYLALDPDTIEQLKTLEGKIVVIHFTPFDIKFFILPNNGVLRFYSEYTGKADTILKGTPLALMKMGMSKGVKKTSALFAGEVEIEGDVELGQDLKSILDSIDIDWEEHLSHLVGDVLAHQVGNLTRSASKWTRDVAEGFAKDVSEYVQEEKKVSPPREEVKDFCSDVDKLREGVERLEARVQHIRKKKTQ